MNAIDDLSSWIVMAGLLIALFAGCGFIIKRFFIDKKYYGGSQFVGRQIYEEFQNADRRESIEHVIYMEEEERLQDFTEGDKDPRKFGADRKANTENRNDLTP